jgi:hypothetical protein
LLAYIVESGEARKYINVDNVTSIVDILYISVIWDEYGVIVVANIDIIRSDNKYKNKTNHLYFSNYTGVSFSY